MTTHTAEKAIDVAFQTIVSFIALQPIEYTGLDGSIQQADPSTPIGDLIVKLGAQLVLDPTPLVAVLDDASDTQVEVPYTAAVGDIVVLNEDGSVPVDPEAGTNFFTEEEWNKLIVPDTEVDTPTEPVAVPVAATDSTPSQAPTVDTTVTPVPVQIVDATVDTTTQGTIDPSVQSTIDSSVAIDPVVVTQAPVSDVVTPPVVDTSVTVDTPVVDPTSTTADTAITTPATDPVSASDISVQTTADTPTDSSVQVAPTDSTPVVVADSTNVTDTVDPTTQSAQ
jgi:hypothetical protein